MADKNTLRLLILQDKLRSFCARGSWGAGSNPGGATCNFFVTVFYFCPLWLVPIYSHCWSLIASRDFCDTAFLTSSHRWNQDVSEYCYQKKANENSNFFVAYNRSGHFAYCSYFSSPLRGLEKYNATRKTSARILCYTNEKGIYNPREEVEGIIQQY